MLHLSPANSGRTEMLDMIIENQWDLVEKFLVRPQKGYIFARISKKTTNFLHRIKSKIIVKITALEHTIMVS